ncbi:uncharacterized protein LOC108903583 [Anoplophora glabripennis]|uniref:uncharacterized protein LOC108903583 n=1 Tax=Anoplophora glabripennis TaxID=217634 RepID=UPI0008754282|nr:uncharacterized protein LOC108903583 [Anoplophora glabripennis]
MKFCAFVILVCIQTTIPLTQGTSILERINEYLACLKNLIPEEVHFPDIGFAVPENKYFAANVNITNSYISGLRDFDIDIDYSGVIIKIPKAFTLTINNGATSSEFASSLEVYKANFLNYDIDTSFSTAVSDIVIKAEVDFKLIPLGISLSSFSYNIGDITFDIQGVISDTFSKVLTFFLNNTVANGLNAIEAPVSEWVVDIVNSLFHGVLLEVQAVSAEKMSTATDEEKIVEVLDKFFELLNKRLGLTS